MKSSFVFVAVALSVASLVGCAAPAVGEDTAGGSAAVKSGTSLTSKIPSGLYSDGYGNYLRAFASSDLTLADKGEFAVQRLQWAFDGVDGQGSSDGDRPLFPDVISVKSDCARSPCDGQSALSVTVQEEPRTGIKILNVMVTSRLWPQGLAAPSQLFLKPASYSTLEGSFTPLAAEGDNFKVRLDHADATGINVTVSRVDNNTRETKRLTWAADGAFRAESDACGQITLKRSKLYFPAGATAACPNFYALFNALADVSDGVVELQKSSP